MPVQVQAPADSQQKHSAGGNSYSDLNSNDDDELLKDLNKIANKYIEKAKKLKEQLINESKKDKFQIDNATI